MWERPFGKDLSATTLSVTTKIWLSIGVFVLGFILTTAMQQIQGLERESRLRTTSNALFPAAQKIQAAGNLYDEMSKDLSDAILTMESPHLQQGLREGAEADRVLNEIAQVKGLSAERV